MLKIKRYILKCVLRLIYVFIQIISFPFLGLCIIISPIAYIFLGDALMDNVGKLVERISNKFEKYIGTI